MKSVPHKVAALTVVSLQMLIVACSSPRFTMFETEKKNITSAVLITDVLAVEDIIGDTDRVILQTNQSFADRAVKEVSKILEAKGYPITKIYPAQIGYFGKHKFYRVAEKSIDRDDNETLPIQQTPLTPDTLLLDKNDANVTTINQYLERSSERDEADALATTPQKGNVDAVFFLEVIAKDVSVGQQIGQAVLSALVSGLSSGGRYYESRSESDFTLIKIAVIDNNTKKLLYRTSRITNSYSEGALNDLLEWLRDNFPSVIVASSQQEKGEAVKDDACIIL